MEGIMAVLTDKQQSPVWAIGWTGMPTHRTGLTRVTRINLDCHTPLPRRFVGNHGVQLGKGPLRLPRVGLALLFRGLLAFATPGTVSNVCQVFQSNQAVGVGLHNALTHDMIGVLLQPSLSSTDGNEPSGCGASAFLLQTLAQSFVVVGLGNQAFARVKATIPLRGTRDSQGAAADIDPGAVVLRRCRGIRSLHLPGH